MNADLGTVAGAWGVPLEVLTPLIAFLAAGLVQPLTQKLKGRVRPEVLHPKTLAGLLSAALVVFGGLAAGVFPLDSRGVVNALVAAWLTYTKATGDYEVRAATAAHVTTTADNGDDLPHWRDRR